MRILMVAAENDALPGGKVGGIGDVIREVPEQLAEADQQVDVILPDYGFLAKASHAKFITLIKVEFAGVQHQVKLYRANLPDSHPQVTQWLLAHPLFASGDGKIYCNDPSDRPFASDASKFALFGAAVATALVQSEVPMPDVLHLHDWHASFVAILRQFDPAFGALKQTRQVLSIHNLAFQGIRPLSNDESSLAGWYPQLEYDLTEIQDPRYNDCVNPMRAAIRLSDKVHAVSPSYTEEIQRPSRPEQGFFAGEGLHRDLQLAAQQGRLVGILNGCLYAKRLPGKLKQSSLLKAVKHTLSLWTEQPMLTSDSHLLAQQRLKQWQFEKHEAEILVTAVSRLTEQKFLLLLEKNNAGVYAIDALLEQLGDRGRLLITGTGDPEIESMLTEVMARWPNFLFLCGYATDLTDVVYRSGDLFLMPSSFEPCGISQMLAMRAGQPCLVHAIGGLKDTVKDGENGFAFAGDNLGEQVEQMLAKFSQLLDIKLNQPESWQQIASQAKASRFYWQESIKQYIERLYF